LVSRVPIATFAAYFLNVRQNPYSLKLKIMKKGLHPESYRFVVFKDMSNGISFLSRSTAPSRENVKWEDGKDYPLIKLEISNTSHPFFTGKNMLVDTAGRIDKFKKRYEKKIK
jgi:large subunit ribosomal protein L31